MKIERLFSTLILGMALLAFPACEGILDGIYDEELTESSTDDDDDDGNGNSNNSNSENGESGEDSGSDDDDDDGTGDDSESTETTTSNGYGFISVDGNSGTIYINSTDYYTWTLLNFHNHTFSTLTIDSETLEDPFTDDLEWDIAVHRWDARTNGGAALETSYTSLSQVTSIPTGTYVEDVLSQVTADMSGMMTGDIGYSTAYVNTELSKWMDVDTSGMPPSYTASYKVYSVRLSDGTYIALILSNYFKNGSSDKGYLTIDYIYPIE